MSGFLYSSQLKRRPEEVTSRSVYGETTDYSNWHVRCISRTVQYQTKWERKKPEQPIPENGGQKKKTEKKSKQNNKTFIIKRLDRIRNHTVIGDSNNRICWETKSKKNVQIIVVVPGSSLWTVEDIMCRHCAYHPICSSTSPINRPNERHNTTKKKRMKKQSKAKMIIIIQEM